MCDYDGLELGMDGNPFINFWGSLSDQIEDADGAIRYRYLTPYAQAKLAFCNLECLSKWAEEARAAIPYVHRKSSSKEY